MNRRVVGPTLLAAVMVFALIGTIASALSGTEAEPALKQETKTVCHKEEGQPDKTLTVPISAYQAHIDHGDTDGPCGATPTVPPPTPRVATNTPTAVPPTATATLTNTPGPGEPTATATLTNTPGPGEPTATATATATATESVIVKITPSTNITPSKPLSITLPAGDGLVCEQDRPTCQYCCPGAEAQGLAEAERALAEARWYNALADALNALMDGDVPEFLKLIVGSD